MESAFTYPLQIVFPLSVVIVTTAYFLRGFTGFGSAIFGIPILLLFTDIRFAVPAYLILDAGATIILTFETKSLFKWHIALPIMAGMVPGIIVGTYILASYDIPLLKIILGIMILIFSLYIFSGMDIPKIEDNRGILGFTSGILSGVLGGIFGISGPPVVIYLKYRIPEKDLFRAQIAPIFIFENLFRLSLYAYGGLYTGENLKFALILLPAMVIGLFLGSRITLKASQRTFDIIAAGILAMAGAGLLIGF